MWFSSVSPHGFSSQGAGTAYSGGRPLRACARPALWLFNVVAMLVKVVNNDITAAVRTLKRKLAKDHLDAALRLYAIPKRSERLKDKKRRAEARRRKRELRRVSSCV